MTVVRKLSDLIYSVERVLAILLFTFLLTTIVLGVFYRYFLHSPLSWSEEFGMFALVWVTFIGGSMSIKMKKAAAVSFLIDRLPTRMRGVFLIISMLITFLFCLYIFYLSAKWISDPMILLQKSQAVQLPMIIPYFGIPVGMLFMTIHTFDMLLGAFQDRKGEA